MINYDAHQRFLEVLIRHNVKFLLIGGYAVNFHGYNRTTGDMDIWLEPSNENKNQFLNALKAEQFDEEQINALEKIDFSRPVSFYTGQAPLRIDFLTKITGVTFKEAYEKSDFFKLSEYKIPVLNLHDLILSKISNGRPQDKADIEELQRINRKQE